MLLGSPPSSFPHDIEAVWELAEYRLVYTVQQPERVLARDASFTAGAGQANPAR
jgi:hypothetical protein